MTIDLEAARTALCERIIEHSDDKTYHRISNDLREAEACITLLANPEPRPIAEYHEDMGSVLWWCWVPAKLERADDGSGPPLYHAAEPAHWLGEAPYVGSPLDLGFEVAMVVSVATAIKDEAEFARGKDGDPHVRVHVGGWPGYHTHFTPLPPMPRSPA